MYFLGARMTIYKKQTKTILSVAVGSILSLTAYNTQAAEDEIPTTAENEVEKITITGSRIQRTDLESAKPVTIITSADISKTGLNSIAEVLGQSIFNSGGSFVGYANNSMGNHAATDLRGLGSGRTLTLINGRRAAKGGSSGGDSFNLNMLPLAAVERIEILRDGASAIYGSDAMGGVINIITKDDYEGLNITANGMTATRGGMDRGGVSITMGSSSDKSSLVVSLEHQYKGGLKGGDRPHISAETNPKRWFSSSSPWGTFYIHDFDKGKTYGDDTPGPNCPEENINETDYGQACGSDVFEGKNYLPTSKKDSILTNFKYQISDDIEFYNTILYVGDHTSSSGTSMWYNGYMSAENPNNPTYQVDGVENPYADEAYRVKFFHRMEDSLDRTFIYDTKLLDINTGLNLDFEAGSLSVNLSHSKETFINQVNDYYITEKLEEAVANGDYNPFEYAGGPNATKDVIDTFAYSYSRIGESSSQGITVDWAGLGYELAGGEIGYAVGVEYRKVELRDIQDRQSRAGNVKGPFGGDTIGEYNYQAAYAEIELPLTETFTLSAASRYDSYSMPDESQVSSSISAQWEASDDLKLRTSFSQGFRVASFTDISGDDAISYDDVEDTTHCLSVPIEDRADSSLCRTAQQLVIYASNPNLEPETSEQYSLGLAYNVTQDIGLTLDYWKIQIENEVSQVSGQTVLREEAAGNLEAWGGDLYVIRDPEATDFREEIIEIGSKATNYIGRDTSGIDLQISSKYDLDEFGDLNATFESTYIIDYNRKLTTTMPEYDYVGYYSRPEWRANLNLNYIYDNISAFVNTTYVDSTLGLSPSQEEAGEDFQSFSSMTLIDFGISYSTDNYGTISYIMRNVADKLPKVNTDDSDGYNASLHSITGRTNQLRWSMNF